MLSPLLLPSSSYTCSAARSRPASARTTRPARQSPCPTRWYMLPVSGTLHQFSVIEGAAVLNWPWKFRDHLLVPLHWVGEVHRVPPCCLQMRPNLLQIDLSFLDIVLHDVESVDPLDHFNPGDQPTVFVQQRPPCLLVQKTLRRQGLWRPVLACCCGLRAANRRLSTLRRWCLHRNRCITLPCSRWCPMSKNFPRLSP